MKETIKKIAAPLTAWAIIMTWCTNQPEISKVPEVKTKKHKSECDLVIKNWQSDTIAKLEALWVKKEQCSAYNEFAKKNFKKVMGNKSTEEMAVELAFHSNKKDEVKISDENLSKIEDEFQCDTKKYKWLSVYDNNLADIYNCSAEIRKKYSWFFEIKNTEQEKVEIKEKEMSSREYNKAYFNYYKITSKWTNHFDNLSISEQRKYLKEDNDKVIEEIIIDDSSTNWSSNISLDD